MILPLAKPDITKREKTYVLEVLASGQLSAGEKIKRFEAQFCQRFDCRYAVAMNSGTSALHVAVKTLGLKKGDEVITTPYSFIASSNCLVYEGVKPVFIDIHPGTLNLDTKQIESKISARTKAILPVHIFGQACNMDDVLRISQQYDLHVIEDACEAIGASWKGQPVGTLGNIGVFAFYPNKQITTGEGGVLVTNRRDIYELACSLRNQGRGLQSEWLSHDEVGYNYRMSELQAAVGLAQMERLDEILEKRDQAAQRYIDLIKRYQLPVTIPELEKGSTISWFVFIIVLPPYVNRERIIQNMLAKGIQTKPYFPSIHLQRCYRQTFGFDEGDYPYTEGMAQRTLAIPFFSTISAEDQERVIRALHAELEGGSQNDSDRSGHDL